MLCEVTKNNVLLFVPTMVSDYPIETDNFPKDLL